MAVIYIAASLIVIIVNVAAIPSAFSAIFVGAFNPSAVAGGLAGVGGHSEILRNPRRKQQYQDCKDSYKGDFKK